MAPAVGLVGPSAWREVAAKTPRLHAAGHAAFEHPRPASQRTRWNLGRKLLLGEQLRIRIGLGRCGDLAIIHDARHLNRLLLFGRGFRRSKRPGPAVKVVSQ
jgi:hypothetical protein